jgi:hypothetical protein
MDDYESMKIFNPYVQMALGILAGNSGVNKSQAFANAMGGGLNAAQAAQVNQQRQSAASRDAEMHKLKLDEYARMQASVKNARAFAAKMAEKGGPLADYWKGVSETDDPTTVMGMGRLSAQMEQNAIMRDRMNQPDTNGGIGFSNLPADLKDFMVRKQLGEIPPDMTIGDFRTQRQKETEKAATPVNMPKEFGDRVKKYLGEDPDYEAFRQNIMKFRWSDSKEYDKAEREIGPRAWTIYRNNPGMDELDAFKQAANELLGIDSNTMSMDKDVVIDSKGQKWKYNGSGDKKDINSYTRVE